MQSLRIASVAGLLLSMACAPVSAEVPGGALRGGNSTTRSLAPQCLYKDTLEWTSSPNGAVLLNGNAFHIKGISWFGIEKGEEMLHGLNKRPMGDILDFVKTKFNVIRVPFSVKFALSDPLTKRPDRYIVGFGLEDKTSFEILDIFVAECGKRGIFIMLDQHDIVGEKAELWYEVRRAGEGRGKTFSIEGNRDNLG
ncbi:cellulase 2 [Nannochloropsis gaditana]|uniref:Cellulase 2 n=1 Tax=Nannochloropsis gaditana TaxID=72520 RepID=W7TIL2_9STRA|nr:cellulase 2 [Nannochloropsis gaditana]